MSGHKRKNEGGDCDRSPPTIGDLPLYVDAALYLAASGPLAPQGYYAGPIVLTALAGFSYLKELLPTWAVAVIIFLSTLIPSIAKSLDIQTHVDELKRLASEWKSLQDRFRQLAKVTILGPADKSEAELSAYGQTRCCPIKLNHTTRKIL
jgi:hypothetical protein